MNKARTIESILKKDMLVLTLGMPIRRAVALLMRGETFAAPVVDEGGVLRGILTRKDCFRPVLNASYYQEWKGTVADHMTREVDTLSARTDLITAAETFLASSHRSFPVMDGEKLVGMLCRSEVLQALVELG